MKILLRTWTWQSGGERSSQDRVVEVERLRIGRGTDQDLELADVKISHSHARIVRSGRNVLLVCKPGATALVNSEPARERKLRSGDVIEIGRYRLTISAGAAGADLMIEIEETVTARDEKAARQAKLRTSLDQVLFSRRRISWLLFLLVLLSTLALPAWFRFGAPPAVKAMTSAWPGDRLWMPGSSSPSHAYFKNDCGKCHQQAFVPVRNEACLECHKDVKHHVDDERWAALPAFAQSRCEDCHQEHSSQIALIDKRNFACTDCHANPGARFPGSMLEAISDFSRHHPAFRPRVARYKAATRQFDWIEVSQENPQELYEQTNLKYSHEVHLSPKGVKSPNGLKTMKCADCHEVDSSGISFKPVDMERHCASCHRLDFDPENPSRVVPHGNPAQAVQSIRDYYARAALTGGVKAPDAPAVVQLRRKPGEQLEREQARAALTWADRQSRVVIDEIFDKRICSYCHTVQRTRDPDLPWEILPVNLQERALAHTQFSHDAHKQEKCESCHAARTSKKSDDVLLPDLKRCRDCHGDADSDAKIRSGCTLCHGYHIAQDRLMADSRSGSAAATVSGAKP
ncbi:MAG: FHA domain-containing protein [Nevskiaceae bacterium]|nr:MAG: FHA domain-containing protein [Nevskiaceae bacterium]